MLPPSSQFPEGYGVIDSHAHLQSSVYGDDLHIILQRARAAGVSAMIAVASDDEPGVYEETMTLCHSHADLWMTAAVHPHNASRHRELWPVVKEALEHPRCVALGEFGLDYHYDFSPRHRQEESMRIQLDWALTQGLPVALHIREAHQEALAILDEFSPSVEGVIHCFSAGPDEAQEYLKRGFYLSFPGIITFKKADEVREAACLCPLDRLLLETDSPYLAPSPHRGKRNEPANVSLVLHSVASLLGISPMELADQTSANTRRLFRMEA